MIFREWRVGARVLFFFSFLDEQADTYKAVSTTQNTPVFLRLRPRDPV